MRGLGHGGEAGAGGWLYFWARAVDGGVMGHGGGERQSGGALAAAGGQGGELARGRGNGNGRNGQFYVGEVVAFF